MNLESLPKKITVSGKIRTREVRLDGQLLFPNESLKHRNHSPDGFNWGYGGSGPAQLALGILLKYMSPDVALAYHQSFKSEVIAKFPMTDFEQEIDFRNIMIKIFNQ